MISIMSIFFITIMSGCSNVTVQGSKITETSPNNNVGNNVIKQNKTSTSDNSVSNTSTINSNTPEAKVSPTNNDATATLLLNIMQLAKQGKVINCEFAAKTNLGDVENKWGNPDKSVWIPAAKGTYVTYSKENIVFGYNKGVQIFDVRTFDAKVKGISLYKTKKVLGTPAYDVKASGQEIIGYVANNEFKLLLVFPEPTSKNPDPLLDHYSILYPQGTIDMMANDNGREW